MPRASLPPNSLASGIAKIALAEGRSTSRYSGVVVYNITIPEEPTQTLYPSSLILVGAGEKRGYLAGETFVYDPAHYLVVTSPLPMLCQTIASAEAPVLTLGVEIDLEILRELLVETDTDHPPPDDAAQPTVFRAELSPTLEEAGARLLRHLAADRTTRALARQTVREMLFHVLDGPYGNALRALAHGPTGQLTRVLRHMGERYNEHVPVDELARLARMSVPTFHEHFKRITATTPLQYIKALRLTRARQLLQAGTSAKNAAHEVGYESVSQFSREFSRFFGASPSEAGRSGGRAESSRRVGA